MYIYRYIDIYIYIYIYIYRYIDIYIYISNPANIYLFKDRNKNTRKRCEICLKFTIKKLQNDAIGVFYC